MKIRLLKLQGGPKADFDGQSSLSKYVTGDYIGVICGGELGLFCIDVDSKNEDNPYEEGSISYELISYINNNLKGAYVEKTPSGGSHIFFQGRLVRK